MSRGVEEVRRAALGGNRAFQVVDGGKGGGGGGGPSGPSGPGSSAGSDDDPCPVTPLGDYDGTYHFLDPIGQKRELNAHQLGGRHNLIGLFRGDDSWLRRKFPVEKEFDDGNGKKISRVVDFRINDAAKYLIKLASSCGLYGKGTEVRQPGIWRADDGQPVIHCGDAVLIDGVWMKPGLRTGKQVWGAAEATPRPGQPCDASIATKLQQDLQSFWCYRNTASPIAILGILFSGYLCGALDWRNNGFVTGGTATGKSSLRRVIRNAWPMHDYSNDTSKAGMEQTIQGRAMPAIIDEANDRNRSSGRDLLDIVLSASGDEGTKLARGTADGRGRSSVVISNVIMFSINPPELEPQHLNRFVMIELDKPEEGVDYSAEHKKVAAYAAEHAASLWGRAIASWERYTRALVSFRDALREHGCDPREMDGKGALLAGWFVLTHEGLPDARQLKEGVGALGEFIVTSGQAAADDGPRRALLHMLNFPIQLSRSTDRDPVGVLLERAFGEDADGSAHTAIAALRTVGMRPVRACSGPKVEGADPRCRCMHCWDSQQRKPVPRCSSKSGLWLAKSHSELGRIFANTPFSDGRWWHELGRLETAVTPALNVRVGGAPGRAMWVDYDEARIEDDW